MNHGTLRPFMESSFQKTPAAPRICIAPGRAIYVGPGLDLAPHMNVATTIAVALADPFELRFWTHRKQWSVWKSSTVFSNSQAALTQPSGLNTRSVLAGYLASLSAGLRGRATNSPPQLGQ